MSEDIFTAARQAKHANRAALLGALVGDPAPVDEPVPDTDTAPPTRGGFDGGARQAVPLPGPTHGEVLVDLIERTRVRESGNF